MKLVFSLAVITRNNQKIEDLIKPYMRNNEDLSLCIKERIHKFDYYSRWHLAWNDSIKYTRNWI